MPEPQFTMEQIKEMAEVFSQVQTKHNPTAGAATFNYAHGPSGMFSEPGIRPEMYSALVGPRTFFDAVPWMKSDIMNEKISILTGQLGAEGTNATTTCGDPPNPGDLKKCTRLAVFGELFMKTDKVAVTDIGRRNDRADVERLIQNSATSNNPLMPDLLKAPGLNFMSTKAQALYRLGNMVSRTNAALEVDGNSATAAGASITAGVITEYDGLSLLVKTGHIDLATSIACPAADSHIINWNRAIGATWEGLNIIELLNDVYFSRKALAGDVGLDGVKWALVMDKRLFRAMAQIAACVFANTRCSDFTAGEPGTRTQEAIEARFMEMQTGQFLLLDGDKVPVLFTSGSEISIPDESGNDMVGDIFLIPMTWAGGTLTFGEYFPLDNQWIKEWEGIAQQSRTSHNNGMYLTAIRSDGFCDEILLTGRFRLRLDTPFLAARLDNITFNSYKGYRDFKPGGTFFYDGGVTYYT